MEYPAGWAPEVVDRQGGYGVGVSDKYGPRPMDPDTAARRGTPEWRAAFNAQREWMQKQFFAGATLGDMGFANERGKGMHAYTALRAGDFGGFRPSWARGAAGFGRSYYGPGTGIRTPVPGNAPTIGLGGAGSETAAPSVGSSGFAPPSTSPGFQPPTAQFGIQPTGMLIRRGRKPLSLRGFAGG